jgi:glucosamine 6-phosphate synthetase-like amidotransferase/phosphosugar isomerase protein
VNPELFLADVLSAPERLAGTLDAYDAPDGPLERLAAASVDRVVLIGMGSSRFAALTASALLRSRVIPAWAEYASSAVPSPPAGGTLAVGISASGATSETVAALERHAGTSTTVAVTNVPGSAIEGPADVVLPLHSGPEPGGVACVSFQATLAVLLLLAGQLGEGDDVGVGGLRPAVEQATSLRDGRGGWLDEVAALVAGGELTQAVAPSHRLSSALQSALMLREGPRLNASAAETGDWLHVDVYLTKRPGYRTLLYTGSAFDDGVLEWATSRSSPVIAIGEPRAGAAAYVPLPPATEAVRALVETGVAELVAARLWAAAGRP